MSELSTLAEPIQRRTLHGELVERLRALVVSGELAAGSKLPEKELCERFGVSRTPLREALKVLASEGFVTLRPNRGTIVNAITMQELAQAFPVMGALEALSGEIACERITDEEIERIRLLHERMVDHWKHGELQPYFRINQAIHEAILEATDNDVLKATYLTLSRRLMGARYQANLSPERWASAVSEHEAMLDALTKRDGPRLSAILKVHLANKFAAIRDHQ